MNTNFLGFNQDPFSLYDFVAKKGRKPQPHPPQPVKPPVPPESPTNSTNFFDNIKSFFGRSISVIRENKWAAAAVFATVNFGFVKLADKVNEISASYLAKFVRSSTKQAVARHSLTATIVLAGNYTFSKLIQYPLSPLKLVAITTGTMAIKLLVQYGPAAWQKLRESKLTVPPS